MKIKTVFRVKYVEMDSFQEAAWYAAIDVLLRAGGFELQQLLPMLAEHPEEQADSVALSGLD